jgi:nitrite reductase (cytochrome c-552)
MRINVLKVVAVMLLSLLCGANIFAAGESCEKCHKQQAGDVSSSAHSSLDCDSCHEGAAEHAADSSKKVGVHFDLELCGGCHKDQYVTYTYGDGYKTRFGGSPEKYAKTNDFPHYNDIIDGHGFTKEYNARRSHNVMLIDHYDIKRGKYDTCLQCKSTKLAYYWNTGKELSVENDVTVKGGHMKEAVTIPMGTKVKVKTDFDAPYPKTHEAQVLVTLPDGKTYASFEIPGAAKDQNWTWSALYAVTVGGLPKDAATRGSGNGCNHCHNPHKVGRASGGGEKGFRIIRKAELYAIGKKGLNPYKEGSGTKFDGDAPLSVDGSTALCGQCHVNYVCGVSAIDKIDRDFFDWSKVRDLEALNRKTFPGYGAYSTLKHVQDWVHGTGPLSSPNAPGNGVKYNTPHPIGEVLTKNRHPEAETYWNSPHYTYGAKCFTCHMPKVTKEDGSTFTSHWMASPYKYMDPVPAEGFIKKAGLKPGKNGTVDDVCGGCHTGKELDDRIAKAKKIQDDTYTQALKVQDALVESLAAIKAAKDAKAAGKPVDAALVKAAVDDHREAHVRWENLVVSENSMGFHNPPEVARELKNAMDFAVSARKKAEKAVGAAGATGAVGKQ